MDTVSRTPTKTNNKGSSTSRTSSRRTSEDPRPKSPEEVMAKVKVVSSVASTSAFLLQAVQAIASERKAELNLQSKTSETDMGPEAGNVEGNDDNDDDNNNDDDDDDGEDGDDGDEEDDGDQMSPLQRTPFLSMQSKKLSTRYLTDIASIVKNSTKKPILKSPVGSRLPSIVASPAGSGSVTPTSMSWPDTPTSLSGIQVRPLPACLPVCLARPRPRPAGFHGCVRTQSFGSHLSPVYTGFQLSPAPPIHFLPPVKVRSWHRVISPFALPVADHAPVPTRRLLQQVVAPTGVNAKESPVLFGGHVLSHIRAGVVVRPVEESTVDGIDWIRISCGWVCAYDADGSHAYVAAEEDEAEAFHRASTHDTRRLASAICATLTKSYSLPAARRMARAVLRHAQSKVHHVVKMPEVNVDELLNALHGAVCLNRNEIFEFIRLGAAAQADPPKAIVHIAEDLDGIISLRPTRWVKEELNVITTNGAERRNNRFVMAAAQGNWKEFNRCLASGQEISVIHSMLKYTALHAASEFGTTDMVTKLCDMGLSVNVRDGRTGQTPLHYAAASGKYDCAQLLLSRGADRAMGCVRGQLPFELAEEEGNTECALLLRYRPPQIVHFVTVRCTETTVSVAWQVRGVCVCVVVGVVCAASARSGACPW
jgi:hypothetical protein